MLTPEQIKRAAALYAALATAAIDLRKLREASKISLVAQDERGNTLGEFKRARGAAGVTLNRWDDVEAATIHRLMIELRLRSRDAMVRELAQLGLPAPENVS